MIKKYLGIDIGGTAAKYAIITANGEIIRKDQFNTSNIKDLGTFVQSLFDVIDYAIPEKISGIGLCSLGIINSRTSEITGGVANMSFLQGINFKTLIREKYGDIPVHIMNDAKAVAKGEQWLGAGRGCDNFFCVTIGTGIGGALVLNSSIVDGAHFRAGEVGYLNYYDPTNYFEKFASTRFIMDKAAKRLQYETINGVQFFDMVRKKDVVCLDILDEWIQTLSRMLANVILLVDVDKIILGGGISEEKEILVPMISKEVERMLPPEFKNQTIIETAAFSNNAGMLGAVSSFVV
jgi:predicted NBD/HSP70 family sugar kinase